MPAFHSRYFLQGTCFNSSLNNFFYSPDLHVTVSYVNYTVDLAKSVTWPGQIVVGYRVNLFCTITPSTQNIVLTKYNYKFPFYFPTFELFFSDYNTTATYSYIFQSFFFSFHSNPKIWKTVEFSYIDGWEGVTQNDGWGRALCSPAIFPEPLFQKKFKSRVSAIFFLKKGRGQMC